MSVTACSFLRRHFAGKPLEASPSPPPHPPKKKETRKPVRPVKLPKNNTRLYHNEILPNLKREIKAKGYEVIGVTVSILQQVNHRDKKITTRYLLYYWLHCYRQQKI